jgi:hypothetical protein
MPGPKNSPEPFLIGLTMAGAVSAGAYTAGVLDFLLRALDAHNARCNPKAPDADLDTPRHKVVLKAVSGASAGGVCTGLSIVGLVGNQKEGQKDGEARLEEPKRKTHDPGAAYEFSYDYTFDALHDVWVENLDLWMPERQQGFLALDDLEDKSEQLQSVLNGKHIDDAANKALDETRWGREGKPGAKYSFLATEVDMFLTTTNLMGAPYNVQFTGGEDTDGGGTAKKASAHKMAQHSAVRHFRISGLGTHEFDSVWLKRWQDSGIPLTLPATPGDILPFEEEGSTWRDFKISAVATGAFPAGLSPRLIAAEAHDFGVIADGASARGGALPIEADPKDGDDDDTHQEKWRHPRPVFGEDVDPVAKVHFVAVDGGVANNEPFEYARFSLRGPRKAGAEEEIGGDGYLAHNPRGAREADRAVIMIDPFPEGPEHTPLTLAEADAVRGMLPSLKRLFPTLMNQARFKPAELMHAADRDIHSRFLIAPSRRSDKDRGVAGAEDVPDEHTPQSGAKAIASGAFGGFSGFFDHSFRVHDFVLGQRNCQSFLKNYFMLNADNRILHLSPEATKKLKDKGVTRRRIIDPGDEMLTNTIALPNWPRIDNNRLDPMLKQADRRLGRVGVRLVEAFPISKIAAFFIYRAWEPMVMFGGMKNTLNAFLTMIVLSELIRRDQHSDYRDLADPGRDAFMREVVVALLNRGDASVTAAELFAQVREEHRHEGPEILARDVADFLEELRGKGLVRRELSLRGPRRYTHHLFQPGWLGKAKMLAGRAPG